MPTGTRSSACRSTSRTTGATATAGRSIVLALRYAFNELNLHRVWLTTTGFNERALKLYEKLGFRHEGRGREHILLDGTRWDIVYMGMLRDEFEG